MHNGNNSKKFCECNWLEHAAKEPSIPIVFDAAMNEYQLVVGSDGQGRGMIYFCPFCGGAAPKSIRESYFATIPTEETMRLSELGKSLKDESEIREALGAPDEEIDHGGSTTNPGNEDIPPAQRFFTSLHYNKLSETADVHFDIGPNGRASMELTGKYLGKPK